MKIHKRQLKSLIEQYLFEEEGKSEEKSSDSQDDKEKIIGKELRGFKGFQYETEDYKHSIVSKDGGLRLATVRKGDGFEEQPLDLSLEIMMAAADNKMDSKQSSDHAAFTERVSSVIAGYLQDNKDSERNEYYRKFFASTIGDVFKAANASRIPIANYRRDYVVEKGKSMLS